MDLAADGQQAVDRALSHDYDLVLMDVQMPGMDGLEATQRIRASLQRPGLPIIAMTANAMASDRAACLDAGMNDHVAKPINPAHLFDTLRQWIRPRPGLGLTTNASEPAAAPTDAALPALPGIEVADGLRRMLGHRDAYLNLLHKFADYHRHDAAQCRLALAQGDRPTALRLAHTLKGLAGHIGAITLQEAARQLEAALKQPDTVATLPVLLDGFEQALRQVIQTLDRHLPAPPEPPAPAAAPLDRSALAAVCQRLMRMLAESNFEASSEWQTHEPMLRLGLGEDFAPIAKAIENFNYDTARQSLRTAALTHAIDLGDDG